MKFEVYDFVELVDGRHGLIENLLGKKYVIDFGYKGKKLEEILEKDIKTRIYWDSLTRQACGVGNNPE